MLIKRFVFLALVVCPHIAALGVLPYPHDFEPRISMEDNIFARVRAQANMSFEWGAKDIVVVPSVYDRWGEVVGENHQIGFERNPFWAYENTSKNRHVFLYQRLSAKEPFFVPNYGFEGAIYLRFIVDHYDNLPPVMVFVQDDYAWAGKEDCLRRDLKWRPLTSEWVKDRDMSKWAKRGPTGARVEQCWRDFAEIFHLPGFHPNVEPMVSFYPLNNFAVGRKSITKRPLAEWKAAYEKAISPVCHNGPLNLQSLSKKVLDHAGFRAGQQVMDVEGITKHTSGGALEHLSNMIYGFTGMHDDKLQVGACEHFLPMSECPESPCAL